MKLIKCSRMVSPVTAILFAVAALFEPLLQAACPPDAVAWWKAEGDATDSAGSNHGTLVGDTTFATGNVGMAFSFDGVGDYVEIPDSGTLNPASFTVEGWFRFTSVATGDSQVLVGKQFGSSVFNSFAIFLHDVDGKIKGLISDGAAFDILAGPVAAPSTWYHIAYTFDAGTTTHTLYVNGSSVDTSSTPTTTTIPYDANPVWIGADDDGAGPSLFFSGLADEVSIFSRALTGTEIADIFTAGAVGKCGDTPPTISCPPDQTLVSVDTGMCDAVVTYAAPVAMDDMPGFTVTMTAGLASGATFPLGTTTVTFEVEDSIGQKAECSFDVTVVDDEDPVIGACPAPIAIGTDPGLCTAAVAFTAPMATDNCPGVAVACSPVSGSAFPLGPTMVTCTATDAALNTDECTFSVTVSDGEAPMLGACPAVMAGTDAGMCSAVVNYTNPMATDNCPGVMVMCSPASGSTFVLGPTTVTCTATDGASNTDQCMFDVTVTDNEDPSIGACPATIMTSVDPGLCTAVVNYTAPTATDNCPGQTVMCLPASGSVFDSGTTLVTCTATDAAGNTDECSFNVIVTEDEDPVIGACPADIMTTADATLCSAVVNYTAPTATDNCGMAPVVCAPASGSAFNVGTTMVTCTATDPAGNTAACMFDVTVTDDEDPVLGACPAGSVTADAGMCSAVVNYTNPTATDNCPAPSVACAPVSGSVFPVGTTSVTCTATDGSGNTSQCMFDVMVTDEEDPVIGACPATIMTSVDPGLCTAVVNYTAPTATDNCPGQTVMCLPASGSAFDVGTTPVTCTATDSAGNTDECSFNVIVTEDEDPVIGACPADIMTTADATLCSAVVNYTAPTATDNCGMAPVVCAPASGSAFNVGTTMVTCTATDPAGNTAACMFDVTVTDDEDPVLAACPPVAMTADAGLCSAVVNYTNPTPSDNCPAPSVACVPASGSVFPVGPTTVTCTATDGSGNTSQCMFDVTVTDDEDPSIGACPGTIMTSVDPGLCTAVVNYTAPTATDNCPGQTVMCLPASGSVFDAGNTLVTCTATDSAGNTDECSFNVIVTEDEDPVIGACPADIMTTADATLCSAVVNYTAPTATDNCGMAPVVCAPASGTAFNVGTTPVTCTATDESGNTSACMFDVTVTDDEDPVLGACPPVAATTDAGLCSAVVNYTNPTPSDNCPTPSVACVPASGTVFAVGPTTVTCTATDGAGNTGQCMFDVTVTDDEDPVIPTCPAAIMTPVDPGMCTATVTYTDPTAMDNCTVPTVACAPPSGTAFAAGTTPVVCTATDGAGNTGECSFNVTVTEDEDPVIGACPAPITAPATAGQCKAVVTWTNPTATDNCGTPTVACVPASGSAIAVGTTSVVCTATDPAGNTAQCMFDVTITDGQDPTITCAADLVVDADAGQCTVAAVELGLPATSDNCGVALLNNNAPALFPLGVTIVTWTVEDPSGNSSTCMQSVTVLDAQVPSVTCPANITVNVAMGETTAIVTWADPAVTDNCPAPTVACAPASGTSFALGTTQITCTATDGAGNTAECMFDVTVTDSEPPVIGDCPAPIALVASAGMCSAVATWTDPTATDNGPAPTVACVPVSGSTFDVGMTTVTCTATDDGGNTDECTFEVTVTEDQVPVLVDCPTAIMMTADAAMCAAVVTFTDPTATDNCPAPTVACVPVSGSVFDVGVTTVTCTATDASDNTSECMFDVTVTDDEDPVLVDCPTGITMGVISGESTAIVTWTDPTATDNCPDPTVACVPASGTAFPLGTTQVTCTATDGAGNTAECMFDVMVVDDEPPVIGDCPEPIALVAGGGMCNVVATWTDPTATDNGAPPTVVCVPASGSVFNVGVTTVTCTATDDVGNTDMCSFDVTLTDEETPTIADCPAPITIPVTPGMCSSVVTWTDPTATDNCPDPTVACVPVSGSAFDVGVTMVTCTATDGSGNTAECSFDVTVTEDEDPVIGACPAAITTPVDPGQSTAVVTWTDPTATDNCSDPTVACVPASGSAFPVGVTMVTCTATDGAGNTAECSFDVTVTDDQPPVIGDCPAPISLSADAGQCSASPTWTDPTATDNGPDPTVACVPASGSAFDVGATTVTCTATDEGGNTAQCTFVVTVTDTEDPVIGDCPVPIAMPTASGQCDAVVTWTAPTATDNCPDPSVACVPASGTTFGLGVTTVTCTASDGSGNTAECSFDVVVTEVDAPTITCPANINASCGEATVEFMASATDACDPSPAIACVPASGSSFPAGATMVTCTATDLSGNTAQCTFTVTVDGSGDTTAPAIVCPANITAECTGGTEATVSFVATATDACDASPTVECEPPSGSSFSLGETMVSCTATDASGNSAGCVFTVTVGDSVDTLAPDITCPADLTGECGVSLTFAPTVTDICDPNPTVGCVPASGSVFALGETQVTCTATDASGNSANCTFSVTVSDSTAPVLSCPADLTTDCLAGALVSFAVSATDACDPSPNVVCVPASGSAFPEGATGVTCTATDASGNSAMCSFTVTVSNMADTTAPVVSCPANLSVDCTGAGQATVNFIVGVLDACDPAPSLVCVPASGSLLSLGDTTVTCTATDAAMNAAMCSFMVTVQDAAPPNLVCAANKTVECATPWEFDAPTVSDACGSATLIQVSTVVNTVSGDGFTVTRTWRATDEAGNSVECAQIVKVDDTAPPTISCAADTAVECGTAWSFGTPTASDTCSSATITVLTTVTNTTGACTVEITRTWVAVDETGNEAQCSQKVTLVDTTPPTLTCAAAKNVECGMAWAFNAPTATDACGVATISLVGTVTNRTGFCGDTFEATRTWVASDACGNVSMTCSQTVTVVDTLPPTITCPANQVIPCGQSWTFGEATAFDYCGSTLDMIGTVTNAIPSGGYRAIRTWRATDMCGNTSECSQTVSVFDGTPNLMIDEDPDTGLIRVCWPITCLSNTLEFTTSLEAPNWLPVAEPPVVTGGFYCVSTPGGGSARFFRLRQIP